MTKCVPDRRLCANTDGLAIIAQPVREIDAHAVHLGCLDFAPCRFVDLTTEGGGHKSRPRTTWNDQAFVCLSTFLPFALRPAFALSCIAFCPFWYPLTLVLHTPLTRYVPSRTPPRPSRVTPKHLRWCRKLAPFTFGHCKWTSVAAPAARPFRPGVIFRRCRTSVGPSHCERASCT